MNAQTESKTAKDSLYMACTQCDSLYNKICPKNIRIFWGPEHLAKFTGGEKGLMIFLRDHIQYPVECKENKIQGRVIVRFIIDEKGKIICPYIHRSLHPAIDKEALRIVKLMPDWVPASNKGVPCMTCYTLPILFKM